MALGGAPGGVGSAHVSGYTHLRVIKRAWAAPDKYTLD